MEFLEKYVVCGVTGSPSTIIATVIGRSGDRKLRLKGPTSEGNLSSKKCGHSYAGMLDVVARDPMPEAEEMAVLYSEHALMHPNPGIPPMRSLRAIIKSAADLENSTRYYISPVGSVTPGQVGLPAEATQEERELAHAAEQEAHESAFDFFENDSLLGDSDSEEEDCEDLINPGHPHHLRASAMYVPPHLSLSFDRCLGITHHLNFT